MKVLLFGEFNRAHWNIKKGLEKLGHTAIVAGTCDGFKKVEVDIEFKNHYTSFILRKVRYALMKLFKIDLHAISIKKQIRSHQTELSGYDVIQFINEAPFDFYRKDQLDIFKWLSQWNNNVYLLSAGLDYPSVKYAHDKKFRYSVLSAYFDGKGSAWDFSPALSYLSNEHKVLHDYIFKTINGVIANDLDYHIPLQGWTKYLGMIPHAINTDELHYQPPIIDDKIVIFHGINNRNYYKKGNDFFEAALDIVNKTHANKIEIITVRSLPYKDYLKAYHKAHILLDQVYAYDQGFNALEAMARGIVVFTGAEKEWLDYYGLMEDTIAINALPNANAIAEKLIWLIDNPDKIKTISKNARAFVEKEHHYITLASKYVETWNAN
ncbi:MAG: glycosyltransferase [Winogradskyella sp.]|nr:glycosyltransferase [Winogradskyella sp.]